MRSLAWLLTAFVLVGALAFPLAGCGGVTAVGFRTDLHAVSGTVSSVQVSTISGSGGFLQVTFVTLQMSGAAGQFTFCGDAANQFPLHTSVTVSFNPGQDCNLISVVIVG